MREKVLDIFNSLALVVDVLRYVCYLLQFGLATIVFDLMPQIGVCCLVGSLMRYFRFGYRNILPLKRNPTWFSIYFQTEEKNQNILHLHLQTYRFILKHHVVTYCCYRSRRRHGRRRRHDFHRGLRDPGYQHR